MTVKTKELCLQTKGKKITFFRITDEVKRFIEETPVSYTHLAMLSYTVICGYRA